MAWNPSGRKEKWWNDLDFLAEELPKRHKDLFFKTSKREFKKAVADLRESIDSMTDAEVIIEMARIVAMMGDSHTSIDLLQPEIGFRRFPIRLRWFNDGLFVVKAANGSSVGRRVVKIGRMRANSIYIKLKQLISHENDQWAKEESQIYFNIAEALCVLGAIPSTGSGLYSLEGRDAGRSMIALIPSDSKSTKLTAGRLIPPIYARKRDDYWFKPMNGHKSLYIQYNSCRETEGKPFGEFSKAVLGLLKRGKFSRIIIDLRNNGGGNSESIQPLIAGLQRWNPKKNDCRVFVIIGKATMSSAVLNANTLRNNLNATLVGEPTGGKPNCYGEVKSFRLPNSSIRVKYSIKYFRITRGNPPSLIPDLEVKYNSDDYFTGKDPAIEKILGL